MGCTASVTDRAAEARKAEREKKERARPNNGLPMMRYKFAPSSPIATFKFPTSHDGSPNGSFDDAASPPEDGSLLDEATLCKISSTAENAKGSSSGSLESKSSSSANKYAVRNNEGTPRSTTPTLTTPNEHESPPLPGLGFAASLLRVPDANSALGQKSSNEDHNDRSFEFPPELDSTQLLDPALAAGSPDGRGLPPPASLGSVFAKLPISASPPGTARSAGQQSTSMAGSMASPVHSKHRNDALENTAPPTQWSQTGSPLFGHTAAPTPLDVQPGPAMPGSANAHHEHKTRDAEEGSLPSDRRGHKPPAPGSATGGAAGGAAAAFGEVSSDALSLASSADGSPLLDAWNPAVRSGTAGSAPGSAGRDGGSTANTHDGPGDSSLWERSGMAVSGGVMSNDAAASQGNAQMTTSSHSDDRQLSEGSTVWDRSQRRPSQQSAIGLSAISMGMSVSGRSGGAMSDAAADPLTPLRLTSLNADMAALAAAAADAHARKEQKKNPDPPHEVQEIPSPKHHNEGSPASPEDKPKSVGSQAPTTQGAVPQLALALTGLSVVPEPMLAVDRVDGEHAGPQAASFTSGLDLSSTTPKNSRFHHSKIAQGQHLRPGESPLLQSSTATAPPPLQSEPVTPVTTTDASSSADSRRLLAGASQPNDVSGSAPEAAALAPKSAFSGSATPSPAGAADSRDLSMTPQPPFPGEPPAMSMAGLSTSSAAMLALDAATLHRALSPANTTPGGALTPNKNTSSRLTADDAVTGNSTRDGSPQSAGHGDQEEHHGGGRSCSQHSHLSHQSEHSERSAVGNAMTAARYRRHVPEPIDSDFGGSSTSFPAGSAGVSPGSGVHPSGLESAESFGVTHSSQHSELLPASALARVSPSAARLSPGGRVSPAASPSSQPLLHSPFMPPSAGSIGMAQLSPNTNGAASSLHSASTSPSGRDPHLHPLNRSPPSGGASGSGGIGGSTHHLAELCDVDRARGECRLPDAPRPLSPVLTLRRGDSRGVVSPNSTATVGPAPQHGSSVSPQRKVLSPDGGGASRTAHELRRVGSGGATAVRRLRGVVHESSLDRTTDPQSESIGTGPQTTAETGADAGPPRQLTSGGGQNNGHGAGQNNGHPQHGHGGHDGAHHVHFAGLETSSSSSASVGSAHSSMMATPVRGAVPPSEHQHYQQRFLTAADGSGTGALRPALPGAESQGGTTALGPIPLQDDDDDDDRDGEQPKSSTTLQPCHPNSAPKELTAHRSLSETDDDLTPKVRKTQQQHQGQASAAEKDHQSASTSAPDGAKVHQRSLSETDDDLTPKVRATLSPIEPKPGLQSSIAGGSTTGLCASRTHTSQLAGAKHLPEGERQSSIPPSPQSVNPHSRPLPVPFGSSRTESPARSPSALGPLIPPASPTSSGSMRLQPGSPAVSSLGRDRSALLSSFTRQTHSRGQQGSVSPQGGAAGAAALSLIPSAGSASDLLLGNVPESPFIDATIAHSALQSTASFQSQSPASPVPHHSGGAGAGAASVSAFPSNPAVTPTRPRGMTHTSATSSSRRTNEETSTSFREQHDSPLRSGGGTRSGVLHTGGLVSRLSNSGIRGEEMGSGIGGAGVAASSVGPLSLGSSLAPFGDSNTSHLAAQSVAATPTNGRRAPPAQQQQQQQQHQPPPASLQQQHLPGQDPRHLVQLHGIHSASQSGSDGQSLLSDRPGDPLTAPERNASGSS